MKRVSGSLNRTFQISESIVDLLRPERARISPYDAAKSAAQEIISDVLKPDRRRSKLTENA